jgi:hypothetical protein
MVTLVSNKVRHDSRLITIRFEAKHTLKALKITATFMVMMLNPYKDYSSLLRWQAVTSPSFKRTVSNN